MLHLQEEYIWKYTCKKLEIVSLEIGSNNIVQLEEFCVLQL